VNAGARDRIELLYDALNRRAVEEMLAVCHPEVEVQLVTGRLAGRSEPYRGHEGLRRYMEDIERVWDELLVTPHQMADRDGSLVVWGRVYVRSKTLGIRDLPVVWLWSERESLLWRGELVGEEEALRSGPGQS